MKKFLLSVIFAALSFPVLAHGPYRPAPYHYHPHYHSGYNWVTPAIIGGVVGYALSRPAPQPVPPPIVQNLPPAPWGYHYEQILDSNCNCYRWVLSPN